MRDSSSTHSVPSNIGRPSVRVWQAPRYCYSSFSSSSAGHSGEKIPYLLLREASIDGRPALEKVFGSKDKRRMHRVILLISVQKGVIPLQNQTIAYAGNERCKVEHVTHALGNDKANSPDPKTLRKLNMEFVEWHIRRNSQMMELFFL